MLRDTSQKCLAQGLEVTLLRNNHSRQRQDLDIIETNILQSKDKKNRAVRECRRENTMFGHARLTKVGMQGE
jgi:hypothetical protein